MIRNTRLNEELGRHRGKNGRYSQHYKMDFYAMQYTMSSSSSVACVCQCSESMSIIHAGGYTYKLEVQNECVDNTLCTVKMHY